MSVVIMISELYEHNENNMSIMRIISALYKNNISIMRTISEQLIMMRIILE